MSVKTPMIDSVTAFDADNVEVEEWPAFPDEDIIEGPMVNYGRVVYRDPTKALSYGVWECEPCKVFLDYGPMSEHIHCIKGEAVVTDQGTGEEVHLTPGVRMIVPVGSKVIWHVKKTFRKAYSVFEAEWDEERYY